VDGGTPPPSPQPSPPHAGGEGVWLRWDGCLATAAACARTGRPRTGTALARTPSRSGRPCAPGSKRHCRAASIAAWLRSSRAPCSTLDVGGAARLVDEHAEHDDPPDALLERLGRVDRHHARHGLRRGVELGGGHGRGRGAEEGAGAAAACRAGVGVGTAGPPAVAARRLRGPGRLRGARGGPRARRLRRARGRAGARRPRRPRRPRGQRCRRGRACTDRGSR
jgi:hypothetical protein